jgi:hypothetical protein
MGARWGDDVIDAARRPYGRTVALHPSVGLRAAPPPVLIIAHDPASCLELERALPASVAARSVAAATDTEGLGVRIVVIGGAFPLAELVEVRAHPRLFDKPVVIFAPCKELPEMDWRSMDVWPVVKGNNPLGHLVTRVRQLLLAAGPADPDPAKILPPDPSGLMTIASPTSSVADAEAQHRPLPRGRQRL